MKNLMSITIAAVLLVGCTYNAPKRTFQVKGVNCSETGMSVEVSDKLVEVAGKAIVSLRAPDQEPVKPNGEASLTNVKELMEFCRKFLSDEPIP